jgi:hypothetical protein
MKHTHKYYRIRVGRDKRPVFRCAIPGCVHKCEKELVIGRFTICHRCDEEVVMTRKMVELAKPHCDDCTKVTEKRAAIIELLEQKL